MLLPTYHEQGRFDSKNITTPPTLAAYSRNFWFHRTAHVTLMGFYTCLYLPNTHVNSMVVPLTFEQTLCHFHPSPFSLKSSTTSSTRTECTWIHLFTTDLDWHSTTINHPSSSCMYVHSKALLNWKDGRTPDLGIMEHTANSFHITEVEMFALDRCHLQQLDTEMYNSQKGNRHGQRQKEMFKQRANPSSI